MNQTINLIIDHDFLVRVFLLSAAGFFLSMAVTPLYTNIAYKRKWWQKPLKTEDAEVDARRQVPAMAGVIFVVVAAIVTLVSNLDRAETWLPLAAMLGAAVIGLADDIINLRDSNRRLSSTRTRMKLFLITVIAIIGGLWFYQKLDVASIHIPFMLGSFHLGWLIIPLFVLVVLASASAVHITDGLDGLAGGLASTAFATYAVIAFVEKRYGVAGFCLTIVGTLLSYTWYNVYPARFFMGNVGSFALGTALGVVAMLTDTVLILPVIGFVFVMEAGTAILQIASEKLRGKKLFKSAPIHQYFASLGWDETKITMRFWVVGQVAGMLGLVIFLLGRNI